MAACGICCDVCELNKKLGCICSSGAEPIAKEKAKTHWNGKGILCLVLACAVERGVAYCMRDCEEFPCQKYYEWCFPYSKDYPRCIEKERASNENNCEKMLKII